MQILITMPIYNDWESCLQLICDLDRCLNETHGHTFNVLIIDDGSTTPPPIAIAQHSFNIVTSIDILRLKRNLGHQRAICIGLAYIHHHIQCDGIVLMDSDGQDSPEDVVRLIEVFEATHRKSIVFARRTKRSEYWVFRFFLGIYKAVHRALTGKGISIGNFSILPFHILDSLLVVTELWSHYAAAVMHARLPYVLMPSKREKRIAGESKMNLTSLVVHGLSAISVYSETIGVRVLIAAATMFGFMVVGIIGIVLHQLLSGAPISLLSSLSTGVLVVLLMQIIMIAMSFVFLILSGRKSASFIPARDYTFFVSAIENAWKA